MTVLKGADTPPKGGFGVAHGVVKGAGFPGGSWGDMSAEACFRGNGGEETTGGRVGPEGVDKRRPRGETAKAGVWGSPRSGS